MGLKAVKFSNDQTLLLTSGEDLHINLCDVES
jgi:hypothetical protein